MCNSCGHLGKLHLQIFREIQSMRFGASKKVCTVLARTSTKHFFTVTEDLNHGPDAIWAHLKPVFTHISKTNPQVDSLEFFCDGPTAQYRQKGNFFFLTTRPR